MLTYVQERAYKQVKPYLSIVFFVVLLLGSMQEGSWTDRYGAGMVGVYMLIDMFFQPRMTWIFRIHHALSLWLCAYDLLLVDSRDTDDNRVVRRMMYDTEWSTAMFSVAQIVRRYDDALSKYPFVLFFVLFVYYRIWTVACAYDACIQRWHLMRDAPTMALYLLNTHWLWEMVDRYLGVPDDIMNMVVLLYHWLVSLRYTSSVVALLGIVVGGAIQRMEEVMVGWTVLSMSWWRDEGFRSVPAHTISMYWYTTRWWKKKITQGNK